MRDNQFPQRCSECGKADIFPDVMPYSARAKYEGCLYTFPISDLHVLKCRSCGEVLFDNATDDQISRGLREFLILLSPEEIRERSNRLGLNQKEFAAQISVAPETVSRWLSGAYIQSRAMDKLMRLFFEREEAKGANLKSCEVPFISGELAAWSHPTSYQVGELKMPEPDVVGSLPPVFSEMETGMPLEMARGPPLCESPQMHGHFAAWGEFGASEHGDRHVRHNGRCRKTAVTSGPIYGDCSVDAHQTNSTSEVVSRVESYR
jgi:putative zinc finger/helix-turn-helix YgiT family protein